MMFSILICALTFGAAGCASFEFSEQAIQAAMAEVDYGNFSSETLTGEAWKAFAKKDYPKLFAYTRKCIELYGEEAKKMNAAMKSYEPSSTASDKWALNDVGACHFMMAEAYVDMKMYPEAVQTYRTLAGDYKYCQCWDPKGWFWRPAENADLRADRYEHLE